MKKFLKTYETELVFSLSLIFVIFTILIMIESVKSKREVVIIDRENVELQIINRELQNEIFKYEKKMYILERKINEAEKINENQKQQLKSSTSNLEAKIIEVVKISKDTALLYLFNELENEQKNVIANYDNLLILKDSLILEKNNIIKSYVLATDKMTNEIERLHAEKNELLINEMTSKGKIKKRNKIIAIGGTIVAGGIATAILLNR